MTIRFAHLLQGAKDRAEQERVTEAADAIHRAAAKARKPASLPAPTGIAARIVEAGRKRRGAL